MEKKATNAKSHPLFRLLLLFFASHVAADVGVGVGIGVGVEAEIGKHRRNFLGFKNLFRLQRLNFFLSGSLRAAKRS